MSSDMDAHALSDSRSHASSKAPGQGDPGGPEERLRTLSAERPLSESAGLGFQGLAVADRLQSTLDIEGLLEAFSEEVGQFVPHAQLAYVNEEEGLKTVLGRGGRHRCRYALELAGEPLGELALGRGRPFRQAERERLEALLRLLMAPLRSALLYRRAVASGYRDPVTGIGNRAAFDGTFAREVVLAQRHGTPLSLLMLDIDHFKRINDRHGHVAGDTVLEGIAQCLRECTRSSDIAFRYGGEEFALVLSSTDLGGARQLASRIREAVERHEHRYQGARLRVTVSLGACALRAGEDARSLLQRVDEALYAAKRAGRNRVESC